MKCLHRFICILLIGLTLLSVPGCAKIDPLRNDVSNFEKYMDAISAGDLETAYSYLTTVSTTLPTPTPVATPYELKKKDTPVPETPVPTVTPLPTAYIKFDEFKEKYGSIWEALGISSVDYEKLDVKREAELSKIKYRATYHTRIAGDITNEYEMKLSKQGMDWLIDWHPSLIFPDMTWGSTVRITTVPAKRGDILASGELLAETVSTDAVLAVISEIPDKAAFAEQAAEIFGLDAEEIEKSLNEAKNERVLIAQLNEHEFTGDLREAVDKLKGAAVLENYGTDRIYPQKELLAHTIGYVGYVGEDEIDKLNEGRLETDGLYDVHSIVGRSGIEKAYETTLRGKDGFNITVRDENGEYVSTVYRKPVEHGKDVHLTIDLEMQRRAEFVTDMVLWGQDTAGAVIAMNPKTGEIKTMLSYPSYDLNMLAISADKDYYNAISKQENKPLQNRMTLGLYPPGSAIKVFTAACGLENGVVTPDYVFNGKIEKDYWTPSTYGRWIWPPIKRTELKRRTEPMNMANCLLHSDNIYFANLALMMGEDMFLGYLRDIGFEQSFPFELSVARSTVKVRAENEEQWNLRSVAETGYGQGQVTISPMQLAATYCAFRNDGDIPMPHVTKAFYETDGVEYNSVEEVQGSIWKEDIIKPETIDTLLPMMTNIMSHDYYGTGRRLQARGCTVAGKTGTAEIGSQKSREVSWFVGFRIDVPEEDELLVLVMLEIPTPDEYKYLKFDIARELISIDEPIDPNAEPTETPAPEETEDAAD